MISLQDNKNCPKLETCFQKKKKEQNKENTLSPYLQLSKSHADLGNDTKI